MFLNFVFIFWISLAFGGELENTNHTKTIECETSSGYNRYSHYSRYRTRYLTTIAPNYEYEYGYCVPELNCCSKFNSTEYSLAGNCTRGYCCLSDILCQECEKGYKLTNYTCVDIDECQVYGSCSGHKCFNTDGSHECECFDSFEMIGELKKTCRHISQLNTSEILLATASTINIVTLNSTIYTRHVSNIFLINLNNGTGFPKSIDYSFNGNYMAWVDTNLKQLNMAPLNHMNPSLIEDIISVKNLQNPQTLSIDWIHDLIYWTDINTNSINVLSVKNPEHYNTLIKLKRKPNDLIVNVMDSCIIWNYQVGFRPQIMRSLQDGSQQTVLYSSYKQPIHLTIDIFLKRYFFIDIQDYSLNSIDFNGSDIRKHFIIPSTYNSNKYNSALIYFDNLFLLTGSSLQSMSKFSGTPSVKIYSDYHFPKYISSNNKFFDFKFIDDLLQPEVENKCLNANCAQICLPSDKTNIYRCVCSQNHVLIDNSFCLLKDNTNESDKRVITIETKEIKETLKFENISEKTLNINFVKNESRVTENVVLILILLTILSTTLFFGYKMKFFKIQIPRYWLYTRARYHKSADIISIEDMDSKT